MLIYFIKMVSAAKTDFAIILYKLRSKGRINHINKGRDIILKYRDPDTTVDVVRNAMRDNEEVTLTDLKNMLNYDIDIQTTIIIRNSKTFYLRLIYW